MRSRCESADVARRAGGRFAGAAEGAPDAADDLAGAFRGVSHSSAHNSATPVGPTGAETPQAYALRRAASIASANAADAVIET